MANVTVNVGELLSTANTTDVLRTNGCDPCVGLLAIYANSQVCAHFSVGFGPPYTQAEMGRLLAPILAASFPTAGLRAAGYTWGGSRGMGSAEICAVLAAHFAGANPQTSTTNDSITSDGAGHISFQTRARWTPTNNPRSNATAELNRPTS